MPETELPTEVAERLGPFYVYLLIDSRTDEPLYVGKGTRQRLLSHGIEAEHLSVDADHQKLRRIKELRDAGLKPAMDIVRWGLDEDTAPNVEAALIDCLPGLTNKVRGVGTDVGRMPLRELVSRFGAEPLSEACETPALLITLSHWVDQEDLVIPGKMGRGYRPGRTDRELYDATRAWWKVSPQSAKRRGVSHAVPVFDGVTRAVYEITDWFQDAAMPGRWAFNGNPLTSGPVFDEYLGPWGRLVPKGPQNPIQYWPRVSRPS